MDFDEKLFVSVDRQNSSFKNVNLNSNRKVRSHINPICTNFFFYGYFDESNLLNR